MKQFIKGILILLLTLSTSNLYAKLHGQPLIDSLLKELPKAKDDTNKCNILFGLSYAYYPIDPDTGIQYGRQDSALAVRLGWKKGLAGAYLIMGINNDIKSDYSRALSYYNEALRLFEDMDDKKGIAKVIGDIGIVYREQGNCPKALEYYFKQLKINEELGDKNGIALVTGNIGNVYVQQSDYPMALEYFFKALKMDEELGDKEMAANVTGSIAGVYMDQSDYPNALEYDFRALKMQEELGDKNGVAAATCNVGVDYCQQSDFAKALEYFFRALKMREETGRKDGIASATNNIGGVYSSQHNYTSAVAWHFKALRINEEIGDKNGRANTLGGIGNDYIGIATWHSGMTDEAKQAINTGLPGMPYLPDSLMPRGRPALLHRAVEYLDKAIAIDKEIDDLVFLKDCYNSLSTADSLLGDYKGAYRAHVQYSIYKDSVFSLENAKKIVQQQMKYDYEKKEALTKVEQEEKDAIAGKELQKQKLVRNGFIGGFAVVLLFAGIFFSQRNKIKEGKKKSDELLLNILPAEVAEELKAKGSAEAKLIDQVTVLFTDFKGFTQLSEILSPKALVADINDCFSAFDLSMQKYGVEKIKTIGDSYMAAGGLPTPNKTHPDDVVKAALEIQEYMHQHKLRKEAAGELFFEIRIGVHTGPVVAGIVGVKKFQYDIWGDTVNTASRMESSGGVGRVNISEATYELVKDKFNCEYRGEIDAKGKGMLKMYYVV